MRAGMSPGLRKSPSIGIDDADERPGLGGHLGELGIVPFLAVGRPPAPALLHQPQAHDVLAEAEGAARAALVGEVVAQALGVMIGFRHLGAHERPGAGADPGEARPLGRHGGHRRAGVVAGGSDDRHARTRRFRRPRPAKAGRAPCPAGRPRGRCGWGCPASRAAARPSLSCRGS